MQAGTSGRSDLKYVCILWCLDSAAHLRLIFPNTTSSSSRAMAKVEDSPVADEKNLQQVDLDRQETSELHALARQITGESHSSRVLDSDEDEVVTKPVILAYDKAPW